MVFFLFVSEIYSTNVDDNNILIYAKFDTE